MVLSLCFKNLNVTNSTLEIIESSGLNQEDSLKKDICQTLYSRFFCNALSHCKFNVSEASPPFLELNNFFVEHAGHEMFDSQISNRGGHFARLMVEIFQQDSMHFGLKIDNTYEYRFKKMDLLC